MDIVVKGRNTEVTERFRTHVAEKLAKIEKLDPKVISVDVECSQERNPRLADQRERIEITIRSRGPVMRAEAAAQDCYAALDAAVAKLEGRLRRVTDRRKVHHGAKTPVSVATATATLDRTGGESAGDTWSRRTATARRPRTGRCSCGRRCTRPRRSTSTRRCTRWSWSGTTSTCSSTPRPRSPASSTDDRAYDYGVIRLAV